jgi:pimeloyl-ACP methyl ester carboxylesterase
MTAVLVHGVPETEIVWSALREALSRDDVVTLRLPGFGEPLPDGFSPTMDPYAEWLVSELTRLNEQGGPVDLVGHDWGGGFTLRLVSLRPDLVRSWVTDAAGLADPDFVWHQFATIWQSPDGEGFMEGWLAQPAADRAAVFTSAGADPDTATALAEAFDRTMADSILSLYRSATKVHEEWGPAFADIPKRGLVIVPSDDPFLESAGALRAAARAGAEVARLDGLGHWWMLQDPAQGAQMLTEFWSSLPA